MIKILVNSALAVAMLSGSVAQAVQVSNLPPNTTAVDSLLEGSTLSQDTVDSVWYEHALKKALLLAIETQENLILETSKQYDGAEGIAVNVPVALASGLLAYGTIRLFGPAHQANLAEKAALKPLLDDYKHRVSEEHIAKFRVHRAENHHFSSLKSEKLRFAKAQQALRNSELVLTKSTRRAAVLSKTRMFLVAGAAILLIEASVANVAEIFIPFRDMQEYKARLQADLNGYEQLFVDIGEIKVAEAE